MSQNLTISDTGLKLIKAFEGYRPVDRELVTGQRIVGYGHRLYSEDAVMMNKGEAEGVLLSDLQPFEEMINTEVHAPMSQSQFDALCSFAYNIGPKAFLKSDTLRALNNGRPLDAANGLDIWRKSEIAGKTYVVDALMRRRTAEKALFLRTERGLPAGREDLPPVKDTTIVGLSTEDGLPVFSDVDANGIVATAPYAAQKNPLRRREDGPAGALQLSEFDIIDESDILELDAPIDNNDTPLGDVETDVTAVKEDVLSLDETEEATTTQSPRTSPIAAAATDIVARLDALIEDADTRFEGRDADWPESLISNQDTDSNELEAQSSHTKLDETDFTSDASVSDEGAPKETVSANVIDLNTRSELSTEIETSESSNNSSDVLPADKLSKSENLEVIDELAQDDAFRSEPDSAAKYIQNYTPDASGLSDENKPGLGLWMLITFGFLLVGPSVAAMIRGSEALLGAWGPIITFTGFVIGIGLILAGIYAVLRINSRN